MKFGPYQQPAKVQVPPIHRPIVAEHDDNLEGLIADARAYAEHHGVKPWTEHIFALLVALDAERAKNTEALAKAWDEGWMEARHGHVLHKREQPIAVSHAANPYRGGKD